MVEITADAARYPHQPSLVSGRQALEAALGSGARERQQKGGSVACYGTLDGRLGRAASEVIEDRFNS